MRILNGRIFRCGAFLLPAALLAVLTVLASGCSDGGETRHPLFQKGKKERNDGDGAAAAESFRNFLRRRPDAVQAHLELAGIYDELLDEPLLAAVHYRNYLERCPESSDAAAIRAWQLAAEQRFCEKWLKEHRPEPETPAPAAASADGAEAPERESADAPERPAQQSVPEPSAAESPSAEELAALREENRRLRDYLADCKRQIAVLGNENRRLRSRFDGTPGTAPAAAATPAGGTVTEYTVQPGDTPGGIAGKVYGSHRLYPEIMRANPGISERSLRPGMVLRIPPRPETARGGRE